MKHFLVLAAGLAFATAGNAGEVVDVSTVASGKQNSTVYPLGEGHVLIAADSAYESFASGPMAGLSGPCFGAIEINGASATGSGACAYSDGAGNMFGNHWQVTGLNAEGALIGTWTVGTGTGKFAGATGGGTFASKTDNATGMFQNTITGAMLLP